MRNPSPSSRQNPRDINVSRARRAHRAPATQPRRQAYDAEAEAKRLRQAQAARRQAAVGGGAAAASAVPQVAHRRPFDYNAFNADPTGTVALPRQRASSAPRPAAKTPPRPKKKTGAGKLALRVLAAVMCIVVVGAACLYWYVSHMLNGGEGGQIQNAQGLDEVVPPELTKDQMNILILGLDYDESGDAQRSKDFPMTDMILYAQFDKKANSLRMLQIPRDSFVGAAYDQYTANTGKINGVYAFGPDQDNKVQNLVDVLNDQLKLKVDGYVTIDMQSLQEMFDAFGGPEWALEVYVPVAMEYGGSRLEAGYQYLKGKELEFFLRQRKDESATPRGDYDRLNNQRYFYSALFKYMRTMSITEMMKLVPWALKYVNTSIEPLQCVALGLALMKVPNENIAIGRIPVYASQSRHNGQLCSEIAVPETADFLNTYFRPADAPVLADQLNIQSLGLAGTQVIDPEMSHMGAEGMVEAGAGAADAPPADSAADGEDVPADGLAAQPAA